MLHRINCALTLWSFLFEGNQLAQRGTGKIFDVAEVQEQFHAALVITRPNSCSPMI